MKTYSFPCWASRGKGDGSDWELEFEVTEDEEALMITAIKDGACDFDDDERLSELYDRLLDKVIQNDVDQFDTDIEDVEYVADYLEIDLGPYTDEDGDVDEEAVWDIITEENKRDYLCYLNTYGMRLPVELVDKHASV